MTSSSSTLVSNLAEGIHKIKCKDCDCFLEHESFKDSLIEINVSLAITIIQARLKKNLKNDSRTHLSFLNLFFF